LTSGSFNHYSGRPDSAKMNRRDFFDWYSNVGENAEQAIVNNPVLEDLGFVAKERSFKNELVHVCYFLNINLL